MSDSSTCPSCGNDLPGNSPENSICPACLLELGLFESHSSGITEAVDPNDFPKSGGILDETIAADGSGRGSGRPNVPSCGGESTCETFAKAGDQVGPYRLLQPIGEGGFGVVWMAEQRKPISRKVALKVIKAGMDTKEVLARFEAERQAVAMMDHTHIAKVLDAGATSSGRPWFAMELVKGIPITEFCDQQKLEPRERLRLFGDVCAAISHAHQKGVIHRDIKPSNVLVTRDGDKPVVKVIDFGIAKATQGPLTDKTLFTAFEQMIGTPVYMSPEQAGLGRFDIDTRSDIYSLGVLLYELLTGKPPFDGKSLVSAGYEEMRRIIREEEPPRPSLKLSTVSDEKETTRITSTHGVEPQKLSRLVRGELDWIVMKAIEKDRSRRYETANALAADLDRFLNHEPVLAAAPSLTYRLRKFARRNRRRLVTAAAAGAALVLGLAVAGGIWLDNTLQERERIATVEQQALSLIEEAEVQVALSQDSAIPFEEEPSFRRAKELARQLNSLISLEETSPALRDRHRRVQDAVATEARHRELVSVLEEALIQHVSSFDSYLLGSELPSLPEVLATAFETWGSHPLEVSPEKLAEEFSALRKPARDRVQVALAEWAQELEDDEPEQAQRLRSLVENSNSDPTWKLAEESDAESLTQMVESGEFEQAPPIVVYRISSILQDRGLSGPREIFLRDAQRRNPTSFWTNFLLGTDLTLETIEAAEVPNGKTLALVMTLDMQSWNDRPMQHVPPAELDPALLEAAGFLRAAVASRPDSSASWLALAVALQQIGFLEDAATAIRKATEISPDNSALLPFLGMVLINQSKFEEALATLAPMEKRGELRGMARWVAGISHANLGNYEQARNLLSPPPDSKKNPQKFQWGSSLALVAIIQGGRGLHEEALSTLQLAIDKEGETAEIQSQIGYIHSKLGNTEQSRQAYLRAIELDPKLSTPYNGLGLLLMINNEWEPAIARFRQAIALNDQEQMTWSNLALALQRNGNAEASLETMERALEAMPGNAQILFNLGVALDHAGRPNEAIDRFREAIAADPQYTKAYQDLALILSQRNRYQEAIQVLRDLVAIDPKNVTAHFDLGRELSVHGSAEEAIEAFLKTIELKPDHAAAHHFLGLVYDVTNDQEKALTHLRKAVELLPDYPSANYYLGWFLLTKQRKFDEALPHLVKAVELEPGNERFSKHLRIALYLTGRVRAGLLLEAESGESSGLREAIAVLKKQLEEHLDANRGDDASVQETLDAMAAQLRSARIFQDFATHFSPEFRTEFLEEHREEILSRLATTTVRVISLKKFALQIPRQPAETRELVENLKKRIQGGMNFADLAKSHSEDRAASEGGFRPDAGHLNAVLQEAANRLAVGEVSEILEDENSFYLLKVESRESDQPSELDETDPRIRKAVDAALVYHLAEEWKARYLARLQDEAPDLATARVEAMFGRRLLEENLPGRAKPLLEAALITFSKLLGEKNEETIEIREALAKCETAVVAAQQVFPTLGGGEGAEGTNDNKATIATLRKEISRIETTAGIRDFNLASPLLKLAMTYSADHQQEKSREATERALEILQANPASGKTLEGSCHFHLGRLDLEMGEYPNARAHFLRSLEILTAQYGEKTLPVAKALHQLGMVEGKLGNFREGERHVREAVEILTEALGEESVENAVALEQLAILLYGQSRFAKALEIQQKVLATRRKLLDEDDFLIAQSLSNIGSCLNNLDRPSEAEAFQREAVALIETSGKTVPASFWNHLGMSLFFQGKVDEAVSILRKALDSHHQIFAEGQNPVEVELLGNLGLVLSSTSEADEAGEYLRRSVELGRRLLGPDHPDLGVFLSNLGRWQGSNNQAQQGIESLREAVALMRRNNPKPNYRLAVFLHHLGFALGLAEPRGEEAIEVCTEAYEMMKKVLPDTHDHLQRARYVLGAQLYHQKRFPEAEKLLREFLEIEEKSQSPNESNLADAKAKLGISLNFQGKWREAEPLISEALKFARSPGNKNPSILPGLLMTQGNIHLALGQLAKAREAAKESVEIYRKISGPTVQFAEILFLLGRIELRDGNAEPAVTALREALAILESDESLSQDSRGSKGLVLEVLGRALGGIGEWQEAIDILERALPILREIRGEDHLSVGRCHSNLSGSFYRLEDLSNAEQHARKALEIFTKGKIQERVALTKRVLGIFLQETDKDSEAAELLGESLSWFLQAYGPEHPEVAMTRYQLAKPNLALGRFDEAENQISLCLTSYARSKTESSLEVQGLKIMTAGIKHLKGQHEDAETLLKEVLNALNKSGSSQLKLHTLVLKGLAGFDEYLECFERAEMHYLEAVEIASETAEGDSSELVSSLQALAAFYANRERFDEALPIAERTLAIVRSEPEPSHADLASTLLLLSRIHPGLGDSVKAEAKLREALAEIEKQSDEGPLSAFGLIGEAANQLRDRGDLAEADTFYRRCIDQLNELSERGYTIRSDLFFAYAKSLVQQERFVEALPLAERALALRKREYPEGRTEFVGLFELLAEIHTELEDTEAAEGFSQQKDDIETAHEEAIARFKAATQDGAEL